MKQEPTGAAPSAAGGIPAFHGREDVNVLSIQLVPLAAELVGWRHAFLLLAPGPLIGAIAMRAFGARGTGGRTRTSGDARVG